MKLDNASETWKSVPWGRFAYYQLYKGIVSIMLLLLLLLIA